MVVWPNEYHYTYHMMLVQHILQYYVSSSSVCHQHNAATSNPEMDRADDLILGRMNFNVTFDGVISGGVGGNQYGRVRAQ